MIKKLSIYMLLSLLFASCNYLEGQAPSADQLGLKLQEMGKFRKMALRPCPQKSTCVASYQEINAPKNFLKPISYTEPKDDAFNKLLSILLKMKGFKIVSQRSDYIYGQFHGIIGEVSDVEFDLRERGVIHFRSETRMLFYDFGMNKKRIEELRFKFHQNDV